MMTRYRGESLRRKQSHGREAETGALDMRLENKRAIITAAASGMGRAGAELFAREGARVAAIDRDAEALKSVVDAINADGGEAEGFVADLGDNDAVARCFAEATDWLRGVDVLWSHAGM